MITMKYLIFLFVVLFVQVFAEEKNVDDDSKIIGGFKVKRLGKYPFIVSIQDTFTTRRGRVLLAGSFCGGSILAPRWILTASHCVLDDTMYVIAGTNDANKFEPDAQTLTVKKAYLNPNWDRVGKSSDIALLYLDGELKFTENVQPIKLIQKAEPMPAVGTKIHMIGWGLNNDTGELDTIDDLKEVSGFVRPRNDCVLFRDFMAKLQICVGMPGYTACQGDSGGPLVRKAESGEFEQIGVLSTVSKKMGIPCSGDSMYTYVGAYYESFIKPMMSYHDQYEKAAEERQRNIKHAPFVVSLLYQQSTLINASDLICSGSILNSNWILTSSHCFSQKRIAGDGYYIVAGVTNPFVNTDVYAKQVVRVDKIVAASNDAEISLIRLSSPLIMKTFIRPLKLPTKSYEPTKNVNTAGYLLKAEFWDSSVNQSDFLVSNTQMETFSECQKFHPHISNTKQICTQPLNLDYCSLNNGGPLFDENDVIIGVASSRINPCGLVPDVYESVAANLDWIETTIGKN